MQNLNKNQNKQAKERYKEYKRGRKPNKITVIALLVLLLLVIILGMFFCFRDTSNHENTEISEGDLVIEKFTEEGNAEEIDEVLTEDATGESGDDVEGITNEMSEEEIDEIVEEYLSSMNIEAKVGQLFFITPEELTGIGIAVQAGETTKTKMKEYGVGGIIFSDQNFEVLAQMQLMVSNMKVYSSYPIFIAMDEIGALRITNTRNTLEEAGFNMESIESELYLLTDGESVLVSESLNIVDLDDGNVIDLVGSDADIIMADSGFQAAYETVVNAVRSGEIEETFIEEKVRRIMTYKVENGI